MKWFIYHFKMYKAWLSLLTISLTACTTSFHGDAHIDRAQCQKNCEKWQMDLAGMVAMGEYSDGCICRVRNEKRAEIDLDLLEGGASIGSGTVGVMAQMDEQNSRGNSRR
jgi:hypothetical protein